MTLIKNILKTVLLSTLLTTNAFSSDFLVDTSFDDSHDKGSGGWKYDIEKMDVQWASDNTLTVDVYTNFVDYNNKYATYSDDGFTGNIVLGDLLISTDGNDTPFNYAFVLSDADRAGNYSGKAGNHWEKTGNFTEITSTQTSKEYHLNSYNVADGESDEYEESNIVMAHELGDSVGSGAGNDSKLVIDRINAKYGFDKISFSFNVGGIDAFQTASQLAFSWGMSCANDIVSGYADVTRPKSVPEPATILLMLCALAFMANSRKKLND